MLICAVLLIGMAAFGLFQQKVGGFIENIAGLLPVEEDEGTTTTNTESATPTTTVGVTATSGTDGTTTLVTGDGTTLTLNNDGVSNNGYTATDNGDGTITITADDGQPLLIPGGLGSQTDGGGTQTDGRTTDPPPVTTLLDPSSIILTVDPKATTVDYTRYTAADIGRPRPGDYKGRGAGQRYKSAEAAYDATVEQMRGDYGTAYDDYLATHADLAAVAIDGSSTYTTGRDLIEDPLTLQEFSEQMAKGVDPLDPLIQYFGQGMVESMGMSTQDMTALINAQLAAGGSSQTVSETEAVEAFGTLLMTNYNLTASNDVTALASLSATAVGDLANVASTLGNSAGFVEAAGVAAAELGAH